MVKSLYTGVSGLKTHQQKMDVIGNNIANVNTTGYKTNVVTFADVYYQTKQYPTGTTATLGGTNPVQVGYGVKLNTTTPNMTQSGFTFSDSIYDMALDGEGFFQLMDGAGNIFYTRAGIFNVDEQGYLVNADGYHVLGVSGETNGQPAQNQIIRITLPDTEAKCSSATKKINGTDVTISMSAPSDNTNMSVTFTHAEFPYATYSNGILNIFFDMEEQISSESMFEQRIAEALAAGGVTLPDDVEIKFEFASIPNDPNAKVAKNNSMNGWSKATVVASGEYAFEYDTVNDMYSVIGFEGKDTTLNGATVNVVYTPGSTDTTATFTAGDATANPPTAASWTINIGDATTLEKINAAITDEMNSGTCAATEKEVITCNRYVMPASATEKAAMFGATPAVVDPDTGTTTQPVNGTRVITLACGAPQVSCSFEAYEAGEYANNYRVTFAYSGNYDSTKAVWDENNLTITICPNSTADDVQAAIIEAAQGNTKKIIKLSGLEDVLGGSVPALNANGEPMWDADTNTPIYQTTTDAGGATVNVQATVTNPMNAAQREAFFGSNPSISLGGGEDSFFAEVAQFLTTFNLTDGRYGSAQSYKDLENITVQNDGTIIGEHAVHGRMTLGRIDIATFDNPNGLSAVGNTMFAETAASGAAKLAIAGQDGAGEVVAGALEMSNVDLAQEFTDMITTQRGYQANSRVITTSDTMLEELLNLKR